MSGESGVLVVSSFVRLYDSLVPVLKKCGFGDTYHAISISDAKRLIMTKSITSVIINSPISDGYGLDFATECASEKNLAVLMFVKKELFAQTTEKAAMSGILTLPKPNTPETVTQSLLLLFSISEKLLKISDKNSRKNEKAEDLRYISRAKMILINSLGMTEAQAHKYIERRAMEARKTKIEIAESIINSYGN